MANIYPVFPFSRCIYNMSTSCSAGECYKSLSDVDSETWNCIIALYASSIIFGLIGTYLNEIVK